MPENFLKSSLNFNSLGAALIERQKPVIVAVAQSARILTQMAVKLGFSVVAVDCFSDCDTQELATEQYRVECLSVEQLWPLMDELADRYPSVYLLYGSGFELFPHSLQRLAERWRLIGNRPELFAAIQDKTNFFRQLIRLKIEHPETRFVLPDDSGGWLFKPLIGLGGIGIGYAGTDDKDRADGYWQRLMSGMAASALFVADGCRGRVLGYNRQWTTCWHSRQPFQFLGLQNRLRLSPKIRHQVECWLDQLLTVYPLRGLGSIDFVVNDDKAYLLEVNPRIPASAQLYGKSILGLHLQASLSGLAKNKRLRYKQSGLQLVYAETDIRLPDSINWPLWAADLPAAGAIIERGQPICSIIAAGKNAAQVRMRLQQRQQLIENLLNPRNLYTHAISSKR